MRKKLFLAIAMIAYAANGFASNEVTNTLEDLITNEISTISVEERSEKLEAPSSSICNTTYYGQYITQLVSEGYGIDGNYHVTTTTIYQITGQCTSCVSMGHGGTATTTTCSGYGY